MFYVQNTLIKKLILGAPGGRGSPWVSRGGPGDPWGVSPGDPRDPPREPHGETHDDDDVG